MRSPSLKDLALAYYDHGKLPYGDLLSMNSRTAMALLREYALVLYNHKSTKKAILALRSAPPRERAYISQIHNILGSRRQPYARPVISPIINRPINGSNGSSRAATARLAPSTPVRSNTTAVRRNTTAVRRTPPPPTPPTQRVNINALKKLSPRARDTALKTLAKNMYMHFDQPWVTRALREMPAPLYDTLESELYQLAHRRNEQRALNHLETLEKQRGGRLHP